jgi:DNA repair exonuclease SbcCD ATPase subunit
MIIRRITLRDFRRFREAEFELGEGINVVKGPNESGKSTLVQALIAAFFWKTGSRRREVLECATWGKEGFVVELAGQVGDLPFTLRKDFSRHEAFLQWGRREFAQEKEISDLLEEWLGVGSEEAFRSTAAVRQDEVAEVAKGGKAVDSALRRTLTGSAGGVDALQALEGMKKELSALCRGTRGPAKNPGPLAALRAEVERKEGLLREAGERVSARKKARGRLREIEGERKELEERIRVLEAVVEDSAERVDLEEELRDLERKYRELETALALFKEDAKLEREERDKYGVLERILREEKEKLEELRNRRAALKESLKAVRARGEELRRSSEPAVWAPWVLALGLTLFLAGLAGLLLHPLFLVLSGVGAAAAAAAFRGGGYTAFLSARRELGALRSQEERLRREEELVSRRMSELVERAGGDSSQDPVDMQAGYLELLERRKEIAAKLEILCPAGDASALEEEADELAVEIGLKERRLKDLRERTVDAVELRSLVEELEGLRARRESLREEELRWEIFLQGDDAEEELLSLEEELGYLRERKDRLELRVRALEKAVEWLERAIKETVETASRRMEERAGEFLGRITGGRYSRLKLDPDTLEVLAWSPEKGDWVEPRLLSRGTADQLYLAARLSLVEAMCRGRRPPLIFDDPFVTFDRWRTRRCMEVVQEFSLYHQVIVFTCRDDYDEYAHRVLVLDQAG